jgi:hypothetical protein
MWHGVGRALFSNGDSYEGEYQYDLRHGRGVYYWKDGRIYDGMFSEDKRHGMVGSWSLVKKIEIHLRGFLLVRTVELGQ